MKDLKDVKLIKNDVIYNMSNGEKYDKKPEKIGELDLIPIELHNIENVLSVGFDDMEISIVKTVRYFKLTIKDEINKLWIVGANSHSPSKEYAVSEEKISMAAEE